VRSWISLIVSKPSTYFTTAFVNFFIYCTATDKIPIFHTVNGQTAEGKADAPAASQAEPAEGEDDSDDDKEEGNTAPEAGTGGGAFALRPGNSDTSFFPMRTLTQTRI